MISAFFSITLLFLLNSVHGSSYGTDTCHIGYANQRTVERQCQKGGCAIVSYTDSRGGGFAEYKCLNDLERHHPAFVTLACEYSTAIATCYDQYSNEQLPRNIQRLGVTERTFGEVLRNSGIDRFCCCRGDYCNAANDHMNRMFRQGGKHHSGHRHPQQDDDYPSSGVKSVLVSSVILAMPLIL